MATVALTGSDTIILSGRNLVDLADGDVGALEFPNDLMAVKTGKNGNSIYAFNTTGKNADLVLRVIRGSADDKFLNALLVQMQNDPPSFVLISGIIVKRIGKGNGAVTQDQYLMDGGVFLKLVPVTSNVEGNTDQAVSVYSMRFANAPRAIQ